MGAGVAGKAGARLIEVVLMAAIALVTALAVVGPVLGPGGLRVGRGPVFGAAPTVEAKLAVPVRDPVLPGLHGTYARGDAVEFTGPFTVQVQVWDPTRRQQVALLGPVVLRGVVAVAVLGLLLALVRTLRAGDPFHSRNARRLMVIAGLVGIGGQAANVLAAWGEDVVLRHPSAAPYVREVAQISPLPLFVGLAIAVGAEVFRRGALMREEIEGLV